MTDAWANQMLLIESTELLYIYYVAMESWNHTKINHNPNVKNSFLDKSLQLDTKVVLEL